MDPLRTSRKCHDASPLPLLVTLHTSGVVAARLSVS